MLGNHAIKMAMRDGDIVIDPFKEDNLGPNSYDISIGPWVARQRHDPTLQAFELTSPINGEDLWQEPQSYAEHGIIVLEPGELVLAHTVEHIGCFTNIVGEMKSRSSLMRSGTAICIDAGLGDVGFNSRWTMEMYNHLKRSIAIPVGARVGQMVFHEVRGVSTNYQKKGGVYGMDKDNWDPMDMIPRSNIM